MQNKQPDTIHATVNTRLLSKAHRLFTGTKNGRIIEILQNARRAGATRVEIINQDGQVTVRDNGRGIQDFAGLLDLGGSGWLRESNSQQIEQSEDPAGVGLFCLAPRRLVVQSLGRQAVIEGDGWHGLPVEMTGISSDDAPRATAGTTLCFPDDPWTFDEVEPLAVYTGMLVVVDGKSCDSQPFIMHAAAHNKDLGCRIQVIPRDRLTQWQCGAARVGCVGEHNIIVNFYGQTVGFTDHPIDERGLYYLIDLTGEPTGIRLMLPARTQLVENEALAQLKAWIEREAFRFVQRRGHHRLPFSQYQRARELRINLPESVPDYRVGLLGDDGYGLFPVEVTMPEGWDLSRCYRMSPDADDDAMSGSANAHLLGAFCRGAFPFVPVDIHPRYNGYKWADLGRITSVTVLPGQKRFDDWVGSHTLTCVDELRIEVTTDDGRRFSHEVPMAVRPVQTDSNGQTVGEEELYVTPAARNLRDQEVWYHTGGYSEDGDSWDTQLYEFGKELDAYWATLDGPDESLRRKLMEVAWSLPSGWQSVRMQADGTVELKLEDEAIRVLTPPAQPVDGQGGAA